MRRKHAFERELQGTDSSRQRATIESLRDRNAAGYLTFPCSADISGLFFANGSEARISCGNWEGEIRPTNRERAKCCNARPHVSSPSPSNTAHVLECLLSNYPNRDITRNTHSFHSFSNSLKKTLHVSTAHVPSHHNWTWQRYLDQSPTDQFLQRQSGKVLLRVP